MSNYWLQTIDGVKLPEPLFGSNNITISTLVDGGRNINGTFIGSTIGNDKISIEYSFPKLSPEEYQNLLKIFDRRQGGKFVNSFYIFDPRINDWVEKEMYVSDRTGTPCMLNKSTLKPNGWRDISLSLVEV